MKNKVVVITGASSGIGLACAREFARAGARLSLAARNEEKLQTLSEELQERGSEVLVVPTDVTREDQCKTLIDKTVERFGRIDVLICNAGISMRARFIDLDLSVLHRLMDTNFWGCVYCTKYALPYLLESRGSLVGVSSISGFVGQPARTGYSSSKFALNGFLDTLRAEHRRDHLHVMVFAPGFTSSKVRFNALTADGSPQGASPRAEDKMMSAEKAAAKMLRGVRQRKNRMVLTLEGKVAVFCSKFMPGLVSRVEYSMMLAEPDSPLR